MSERWYWFVLGVARFLVCILYPMKVTGLQNMPAEGGAIVCCNHISLRDPVVLASALKLRPTRFMAKAELFQLKWFGWFLTKVGAFPVKRGQSDMASLRTAVQIVRDGGVLGIFAQGHRDASGEMPMESGVALIALRGKAPVIPVRIAGPYRLFHRTRVTIGPAVDLSEHGGKYDATVLKTATGRIERAVRAL